MEASVSFITESLFFYIHSDVFKGTQPFLSMKIFIEVGHSGV